MSLDEVLLGIVVGGIVLSGAYVRAEYRLWRKHGADDRRRGVTQRDLHAARLIQQQAALPQASVVQMQTFAASDGAVSQDSANSESERRSSARPAEPRNSAFSERRARARHSATH
jgi:hypothetical protein